MTERVHIWARWPISLALTSDFSSMISYQSVKTHIAIKEENYTLGGRERVQNSPCWSSKTEHEERKPETELIM